EECMPTRPESTRARKPLRLVSTAIAVLGSAMFTATPKPQNANPKIEQASHAATMSPYNQRLPVLGRSVMLLANFSALPSMLPHPVVHTRPRPPEPPRHYAVQRGDSFWAIAHRFGVNMNNLAVDNHMQLWNT